jgi:diketogulonate reductase-like aldo/keto reductase
LARLSEKYSVSDGEVLLRWVIDQGAVVITTSGKESRLKGYLRVTEFRLMPEEVKEISEEGEKKHFRGYWRNRFDPDDWS